MAVAKTRAGLDAGTDVELVTFPTPKSVYELVSESLTGEAAVAAGVDRWTRANLSSGELDVLRAARGPALMFRRGEPLALMPFRYVR